MTPIRPQDAPKTTQDSPKMAQDGPKTAPKRFQNGPRCPKTFRRRSQDGLKHDRKPQNLEERSAAGVTPQGSQSGRTPRSAEASSVLNPTKELQEAQRSCKDLKAWLQTRGGRSATLRAVAINPPLEYHCTVISSPQKPVSQQNLWFS